MPLFMVCCASIAVHINFVYCSNCSLSCICAALMITYEGTDFLYIFQSPLLFVLSQYICPQNSEIIMNTRYL